MSDRRGTTVRLAALGAALVALLALVALASRAGVPWSGTSTGSEGRSLELVGRLAVDAVLVAFAVVLLGVFALRIRRPGFGLGGPEEEEEEDEEEPASRLGRLVLRVAPYVLLAGIVLLTLLFAREVDRRFPRGEPPAQGTADGSGPADGPTLAPPADAATWILAAAGGLALFVFFAAAAAPAVKRRLARLQGGEEETDAVTRVLDESIDDLRAEADPRRAVIAAYARMERGLAARGHPRRSFEAPLEYLTRVLSDLTADREPVRRLTALFERAKFSRHHVGPEAKNEAIDCLATIRSGLS